MGINPGNPAYSIPPADDDRARKQRDTERSVQENAAARSLEASQIGNGGELVVDGSLVVNGSLTVPAGSLNASGALSAGTSITAGTTVTATTGLYGQTLNVSGVAAVGSLSTPGAASIGGNTDVGGDATIGGNVSAVDVTASGRVVSGAAFRSPGSRAYVCVSGYAGAWIDGDGTVGISPSSIRYKIDIEQWSTDISRLLLLRPVLFRYDPAVLTGAKVDDPKQIGFIAEELEALGFTEYVFYDDGDWEWSSDGEDDPEGAYVLVGPPRIQGILYDRLTVALLTLTQWEHAERVAYQATNELRVETLTSDIRSLAARLDAAGL